MALVIESDEVEAPVRARPLVPSATMDDEADLNPAGRAAPAAVTAEVAAAPAEAVADPMREMTPFETEASAVL